MLDKEVLIRNGGMNHRIMFMTFNLLRIASQYNTRTSLGPGISGYNMNPLEYQDDESQRCYYEIGWLTNEEIASAGWTVPANVNPQHKHAITELVQPISRLNCRNT